jgi:hypothetical protein
MTTIAVSTSDQERRAAALADIKHMHDQLTDAMATIGQLKADLHREEDRCEMLQDALKTSRHAELTVRKLLIELATQMSNISLLTVKAQEVVKTVNEMDDKKTTQLNSQEIPSNDQEKTSSS